MLSSRLGHSLDPVIQRVIGACFGNRTINPNIISLLGVICAVLSGSAIAFDHLLTGAIFLLFSGFFDIADGVLARTGGRVTRFGGFFDSVLDRYSDLAVMGGITIHFMRAADDRFAILSIVGAIGIALIPYARARAEAASFNCTVGLLERPERIVILLAGLFFPVLSYAVLLVAVLSHVTVIQRIVHVWKQAGDTGKRGNKGR